MTMQKDKPAGFEAYLGDYGAVAFDSYSDEPVTWGWKIVRHMGEALWSEFVKVVSVQCIEMGKWVAVDKILTLEDAIHKYGPVTKVVTGPCGGRRYTVFTKQGRYGPVTMCTENIPGDFSAIPRSLYERET